MILSSGASDTNTTTLSSHVVGEAAIPILQSMTSYIQTLLRSIQIDRVIPFPRNNPLYGGGGGGGGGVGMLAPVHVGFIAVMTCPDAIGGGGATTTNTSTTTKFFPGMMGLYRLPNITSETQWKAFRYVFQQENIGLSSHELEIQFPYLAAASAIWARGATTFQLCAKQLRSRILRRRSYGISDHCIESDPSTVQLIVATIDDVQNVFHSMKQSVIRRSTRCDVQFLPDDNNNK